MLALPLQLWEGTLPPGWVLSLIQATDVLSAVLGLGIAAVAFRGYRRNGSRPMLYLTAGFLLAFSAPVVVLGLYLFVPGITGTHFGIGSRLSQTVGLLTILYALWTPVGARA